MSKNLPEDCSMTRLTTPLPREIVTLFFSVDGGRMSIYREGIETLLITIGLLLHFESWRNIQFLFFDSFDNL